MIKLKESKKLDIKTDPPIKSYLHYSQSLSIILADDKTNEWFYSNFIQLYSKKGASQEWDLLQILPDSFDLLHDQYFHQVSHLNNEIINIDKDNIIELVKKWINNSYYVLMYVDEYFLPGTQIYKRGHYPHAQLVYGYNDEEKKLYIMNFNDKVEYGSIEVDYEHFIESMLTDDLIDKFGWSHLKYQNPRLIKTTENNIKSEFCINILINQLQDYIDGKVPYSKFLYNRDINYIENSVWGIDIYKNLISYLECTPENTSLLPRSLFIPFNLLWEHKDVMINRLEFLKLKYNLTIPDYLISKFKKISKLCHRLRIFARKLDLNNDFNCKPEMIKIVEEIKSIEFQSIEELIEIIKNQDI